MAVFFTINGQTHSAFPRSFIRTKCGKASLDKDMLVHISFSGISGADRVDIFPPSRDRMKKNTVTKELEETIRDCISEDATLKLLNEIRFRKTVEKSKVDIKFVTQFVTRLIARNPDLRRYLKTGGQVKYTPELGTKIKEQFKPPFYPTIFRIKGWDDKKGLYTKEIPIDSKGSQLSFELNAPDNYFDRILTPGILNVVPGDMLARRKLMSGVLELKFKPTKNMKIGDLHPVTLSVSRHEHEPLTQTFQVKYIAPIPKIPHQPEIPSTTSEPPKVADLGLPEHHLIYKENWGDKWTGQDIVKMMEMNGNAKTSDIKVCINMSSDDLREYLIRNRITDANKRATVEKVYEIGILLYSFLSYVELKKQYESIEEIPIDGVVSTIMKGISKTMLDLHISEEMLKLLITE